MKFGLGLSSRPQPVNKHTEATRGALRVIIDPLNPYIRIAHIT